MARIRNTRHAFLSATTEEPRLDHPRAREHRARDRQHTRHLVFDAVQELQELTVSAL